MFPAVDFLSPNCSQSYSELTWMMKPIFFCIELIRAIVQTDAQLLFFWLIMLYDNFICSFLNLNHLKSITSWDDLASHILSRHDLCSTSRAIWVRPRQQRSLDTSLTSWQKQRARRQDLGTVDCVDSINRGQRLSLSGFADRNVQGLHPVVQRCCPQLCVYGPYGYDALQHVMPCQATKHTTVATSKSIWNALLVWMRREENFSARHSIVFLKIAVAWCVMESFKCDRLFRRHRVETKLAGLYLPDAWRAKQWDRKERDGKMATIDLLVARGIRLHLGRFGVCLTIFPRSARNASETKGGA